MTGHWIDLHLEDAVEPDVVLGATAAGDALVAIFSDGCWHAFPDLCTHAECSFTDYGEVEDGILICNCHGAEFDLRTGAVIQDPAEDPLHPIPVREYEGGLQVQIEERTPQ